MIKTNQSLNQVKAKISALHEKPVKVTLSLGRKKTVTFSGRLIGVYPALFTVSPFDKSFRGKTSYSYSEYMCGKVKLIEQGQTQA